MELLLTSGDAGNDTVSGVISGSGSFTKAGSGTLTFSANNTYTGDTTISWNLKANRNFSRYN